MKRSDMIGIGLIFFFIGIGSVMTILFDCKMLYKDHAEAFAIWLRKRLDLKKTL